MRERRREQQERATGAVYQLTVSTLLYCGSKDQEFVKQEEFSTLAEARANREVLAKEIIRENRFHCSQHPKEVNYKIDQILA
jgi:hypothetical protein